MIKINIWKRKCSNVEEKESRSASKCLGSRLLYFRWRSDLVFQLNYLELANRIKVICPESEDSEVRRLWTQRTLKGPVSYIPRWRAAQRCYWRAPLLEHILEGSSCRGSSVVREEHLWRVFRGRHDELGERVVEYMPNITLRAGKNTCRHHRATTSVTLRFCKRNKNSLQDPPAGAVLLNRYLYGEN